MDKIKILEDFIDPVDCKLGVDLCHYIDSKGMFNQVDDGRLIFKNPNFDDSKYLLKKYVSKLNEVYQTKFYVRDVLVSVYGESSYINPHIDYDNPKLKDSLGAVFYFNDDYEGGEIYFPNFNYEYKPKKGSIIVFPCNNKEYLHGVKVITSGIRYTMPIEITEDKKLNLYND
jgi:hypothetical protein